MQCVFYSYSTSSLHFSIGSKDTVITVSGSGFDDARDSNNILRVGGANCAVSQASGSGFTCTLGAGSAGSHDLWVSVIGKGAASFSGSRTFLYQMTVTSIQPTTGPLGG